jgi:hypothetical protein
MGLGFGSGIRKNLFQWLKRHWIPDPESGSATLPTQLEYTVYSSKTNVNKK